jgi:hypothetical protein
MGFMWERQYMVVQYTPTDLPPQNGWTDGGGTAIPNLTVFDGYTSGPLSYCIVAGASATEFNGVYVETGTENGKPCYLMGLTYKISYLSNGETVGQWMICKYDTMGFMWERQYMVVQYTPTDLPPQNGWTDGGGTAIPNLTVFDGYTYKISYVQANATDGMWMISKYEDSLWNRCYMVYQTTPTDTPPKTGWTDNYGTLVPGLNVTVSGITFTSVTAATGVLSTSAVLNGTVTSAIASTYHFAYGTSAASLTSSTVETDVSAGTSVPVSAAVTGLTTQTLYYYALVATNTNGTVTSNTALVYMQGSVPTSNLKMWLRADQQVTTSSSAVTNWGDISGNANNAAQATANSQPLWVDSTMNVNPVVRFNGTTSYLLLPTAISLGIQSSPYEYFIVARSSSASVQFLIAGAIEQYEFHLLPSGARFIPATHIYLDQTAAACDGNPHLFAGRASVTGGAIRIDGIDGGTSTNSTISTDGNVLRLGMRSDNSFPLNGDIAEVLIYNCVLTTTARDSVEQYINQRYNINSGALPVELVSFTASVEKNDISLNWQTTTEKNSNKFEIQRSLASANNWVSIGTVKAADLSNSPKQYSFTDNKLQSGKYQYRLKMIDNDGTYQYSSVENAEVAIPKDFAISQNYPNPFNPSTKIDYQLPLDSKVVLDIYNIVGQKVVELVNQTQSAGYYTINFGASNLSSGIYVYRLSAVNQSTGKNFSMIKKMMLLK